MMSNVTQDEINATLDKHEKWLRDKSKGSLAKFSRQDLSGADLSFRDLSAAWLNDASLIGANLKGCIFTTKPDDPGFFNLDSGLGNADIRGADLSHAQLTDHQLKLFRNWLFATYSDDWCQKLSLPADHNERTRNKDFRGYSLSKADLQKCDLDGANLRTADLSSAILPAGDLTSVQFEDADVRNVDFRKCIVSLDQALTTRNWHRALWPDNVQGSLENAKFKNQVLRGFSFEAMDVTGVDIGGADLRETAITVDQIKSTKNWILARFSSPQLLGLGLPDDHWDRLQHGNLMSYDLVGSDLSNSDLQGLNLRGANLADSRLDHANVSGTQLQDSVLRNVDLSTVRGLRALQLRGADLTNAILSEHIAESLKAPPGLEEATKNARQLFFATAVTSLYCLITIFGTTDGSLLLGASTLPLPLIQSQIPTLAFFAVAPFLLIVVFFFLQFALQALCQVLSTLPAIFPDGRPADERSYPWLTSAFLRTKFTILSRENATLARFEVLIVSAVAWWAVPVVLLLFWARFLVRRNGLVSGIEIFLIGVSVGTSLLFQKLTNESLSGSNPIQSFTPTFEKRFSFRLAIISVIVCWILLGLQAVRSFAAVRTAKSDGVEAALNMFGWSQFGNLRGSTLSGTSQQSPGLGAGLAGRDLRGADATHAIAVRIDLRKADLRGAVLRDADLREALLDGTDLRGADLSGANLRFASLLHVRVGRTIWTDANLQGASFDIGLLHTDEFKAADNWILGKWDGEDQNWLIRVERRDLSGTDFPKQSAKPISFRNACLQFFDLRGAVLTNLSLELADLTGADLRGARLNGAHLTNARLKDTDLRNTDLRQVNGLTRMNLQFAKIDQSTELPSYLK